MAARIFIVVPNICNLNDFYSCMVRLGCGAESYLQTSVVNVHCIVKHFPLCWYYVFMSTMCLMPLFCQPWKEHVIDPLSRFNTNLPSERKVKFRFFLSWCCGAVGHLLGDLWFPFCVFAFHPYFSLFRKILGYSTMKEYYFFPTQCTLCWFVVVFGFGVGFFSVGEWGARVQKFMLRSTAIIRTLLSNFNFQSPLRENFVMLLWTLYHVLVWFYQTCWYFLCHGSHAAIFLLHESFWFPIVFHEFLHAFFLTFHI